MFTNFKDHHKSKLQLVTEDIVNQSWEFKELYRGTPDAAAIEKAFIKLKQVFETNNNIPIAKARLDSNIPEFIKLSHEDFNRQMSIQSIGFALLHRLTDGGKSATTSPRLRDLLKILIKNAESMKHTHHEIIEHDVRYTYDYPLVTKFMNEYTYQTYIEKIYLYYILHMDNPTIVGLLGKLRNAFMSVFAIASEDVLNVSMTWNDIGDVLTYFRDALDKQPVHYGGTVIGDRFPDGPVDSNGVKRIPGNIKDDIAKMAGSTSLGESYDDKINMGKKDTGKLRPVMTTKNPLSESIDKNIEYYRSLNKD